MICKSRVRTFEFPPPNSHRCDGLVITSTLTEYIIEKVPFLHWEYPFRRFHFIDQTFRSNHTTDITLVVGTEWFRSKAGILWNRYCLIAPTGATWCLSYSSSRLEYLSRLLKRYARKLEARDSWLSHSNSMNKCIGQVAKLIAKRNVEAL